MREMFLCSSCSRGQMTTVAFGVTEVTTTEEAAAGWLVPQVHKKMQGRLAQLPGVFFFFSFPCAFPASAGHHQSRESSTTSGSSSRGMRIIEWRLTQQWHNNLSRQRDLSRHFTPDIAPTRHFRVPRCVERGFTRWVATSAGTTTGGTMTAKEAIISANATR